VNEASPPPKLRPPLLVVTQQFPVSMGQGVLPQ
jgi:hypothetical protein